MGSNSGFDTYWLWADSFTSLSFRCLVHWVRIIKILLHDVLSGGLSDELSGSLPCTECSTNDRIITIVIKVIKVSYKRSRTTVKSEFLTPPQQFYPTDLATAIGRVNILPEIL